jgi:hypothetical protein
VYLSNSDRIRLGLHEYGSDVPDDIVAAAVAALEGIPDPEPEPAPKKRARTSKGRLQGDDPQTTDKDEAWE